MGMSTVTRTNGPCDNARRPRDNKKFRKQHNRANVHTHTHMHEQTSKLVTQPILKET